MLVEETMNRHTDAQSNFWYDARDILKIKQGGGAPGAWDYGRKWIGQHMQSKGFALHTKYGFGNCQYVWEASGSLFRLS